MDHDCAADPVATVPAAASGGGDGTKHGTPSHSGGGSRPGGDGRRRRAHGAPLALRGGGVASLPFGGVAATAGLRPAGGGVRPVAAAAAGSC